MTIRTFGASIIAALLHKETTPAKVESKPVYTYEQACKDHVNSMLNLCTKFHPVCIKGTKEYWLIIDECTAFCIDTTTGHEGVNIYSTPGMSTLFEMIMKGETVENGYEEITPMEFHEVFTRVQNANNLKINRALQSLR